MSKPDMSRPEGSSGEIAFLNSLMLDEEMLDEGFLDEGLPKDEKETPQTPCPEPMILWALTQKERADSGLVEELSAHIAACPSCADVTQRLQGFHDAMEEETPAADKTERKTEYTTEYKAEPDGEAEWAQTEARLNRWMSGYLESQPDATPAQPPAGRSSWWSRFPTLKWALPLALAACAAAVVFTILASRHPAQPRGGELVQSQGDSNQPTASQPSSDGPELLRDGKLGSAGDQPETLPFTGGEHVKLLLTDVEPQADGSYRFSGRLTPIGGGQITADGGEASFESAEVTGIWTRTQLQGHLSLSIQNAVKGNVNYLASVGAHDGRVTAVLPPESAPQIGTPQTGQTIEIQVTRGGTLKKAPKAQP